MVAVELFFLISGMLITASWFRSRSMEDFIYKRVLRIYPAFITAIIFSAALIWIWCPEFRNTVAIRGWGQSLIHDSLFLTHGSLVGHGIFAANPFQGEANGSLWTINIEFSCYLLVAVLGMFCVFKHRTALLTIGAAIWIYYVAGLRFGGYTQRPYGRFLTFFLAGMLVWLYRDKVRFSPRIALCCLIAIVASANLRPVFSAIFPIAGSYIILWIGLQPSARFVRWTDDRDLSYGVYLFAFPIEQVVASIPALRSPGIILGIALPIALALAAVSWRFIERPALRLKSRKFCDYDPGAPKEVPRAQRLPESFGENLQPAASE